MVKEFSQAIDDSVYDITGDTHLTLILLVLNRTKLTAHVTIRLLSKHAEATVLGLVIGKKTNTVSLHTIQEHKAKYTRSNLLIRSILYDDAQFSYTGGITVDTSAQKTDAYQRNDTLLIGKGAGATSFPFLEISANDVKCTHGATISPIPDDVLWYMETRGISKETCRRMYVEGFAHGLISKIEDVDIQKDAWNTVSDAI